MIISWANILIPTDMIMMLVRGPRGKCWGALTLTLPMSSYLGSPVTCPLTLCQHFSWHKHRDNAYSMDPVWIRSQFRNQQYSQVSSLYCTLHCNTLHWIFAAIILSFIWIPSPGCSCIMDAMSEVRPARCRSRLSWECKLQPKPRINQCADVNTVSLMVTAYHGVPRMWWDYTRNSPHFIVNGCKHGISRGSHIHGGAFS